MRAWTAFLFRHLIAVLVYRTRSDKDNSLVFESIRSKVGEETPDGSRHARFSAWCRRPSRLGAFFFSGWYVKRIALIRFQSVFFGLLCRRVESVLEFFFVICSAADFDDDAVALMV